MKLFIILKAKEPQLSFFATPGDHKSKICQQKKLVKKYHICDCQILTTTSQLPPDQSKITNLQVYEKEKEHHPGWGLRPKSSATKQHHPP
jgi:hypothetical protein